VRVFENRMLRGAFGTKRVEVKGGWRELHNEELHNLYFCRRIGNLTFYMFYVQVRGFLSSFVRSKFLNAVP
jgi:hypothetical protein